MRSGEHHCAADWQHDHPPDAQHGAGRHPDHGRPLPPGGHHAQSGHDADELRPVDRKNDAAGRARKCCGHPPLHGRRSGRLHRGADPDPAGLCVLCAGGAYGLQGHRGGPGIRGRRRPALCGEPGCAVPVARDRLPGGTGRRGQQPQAGIRDGAGLYVKQVEALHHRQGGRSGGRVLRAGGPPEAPGGLRPQRRGRSAMAASGGPVCGAGGPAADAVRSGARGLCKAGQADRGHHPGPAALCPRSRGL